MQLIVYKFQIGFRILNKSKLTLVSLKKRKDICKIPKPIWSVYMTMPKGSVIVADRAYEDFDEGEY